MTTTGKAPSTKKIENALGISDDMNKLSGITSDDEKKRQFDERQKKLNDIKEEFKQKHSTYQQDKDYVKDMYKELAETSMMAVRIMQEEAGMTGDYKNVEALAAAANAVSTALNGLKNVEIDEEKLRIERDKVDIRRNAASSILKGHGITGDTVNNTIVHIGSTGDLIRAMKLAEKEELALIEATAEIVNPKEDKDE